MQVTLLPIETLVSPSQSLNAAFPRAMTLLGIVTLVTPHEENAPYPIVVRLSGIVTLVRLQQPTNAWSPMLVALSGMVTLVRREQYWNVKTDRKSVV